jgi:hypothetical protein
LTTLKIFLQEIYNRYQGEIKMTDDKKTVAPVASEPVQAKPVQTEAEKIWQEIQNREIMMFSLPGQKISNYCLPSPVEPSRCFLLYKAGSAIPAIEAAIGPNYVCEAVDKYIVVSRKKAAY